MPFPTSPSRPDPTQVVAAIVILLGVLVFGTAETLSAQASCGGEIGLEFRDVQLLNSDAESSAGPFALLLPAGTYDVSTASFDPHSSQVGISDQPMEQWYFTLDSGFTSPFTSDIPPNADMVSDSWRGLAIGESASLMLHHQGSGGVNSVWPRCVSFHRVDDPTLAEQRPADTQAESSAAAETMPGSPIEADVRGVVEERLSVATSSAATTATPSSAPAQATPVLALTGGRSEQFVVLALALLVVGTGLMAAAGLKQLVDDLEASKRRRR